MNDNLRALLRNVEPAMWITPHPVTHESILRHALCFTSPKMVSNSVPLQRISVHRLIIEEALAAWREIPEVISSESVEEFGSVFYRRQRDAIIQLLQDANLAALCLDDYSGLSPL